MKKEEVIKFIIGIIIVVIGIVLFGLVFLKGMKSSENIENKVLDKIKSQSLGNLCSGEQNCKEFCLNNRGQCEEYCRGKENELCKIIFPPDSGWETQATNNENIKQREKEECEGTKIKFDYSPVNLDKTKVMLPLGLMTGDHVTPIDHQYFQNFDNKEYTIEVYSPGKGHITDIQHMPDAEEGKDYRVIIRHTCTISSVYIYVSNLPEKIRKYAPQGMKTESVNIPVKAGELIGYYKNNLDYNLVDEKIILSGFVVPEHYRAEPWKIHVPNTYEYFNEPVKSQLIEKSIRTVEPLSGKIDYDIDGKLIGNWFLEGMDGYAGESTGNEKYWLGHLSFVYDAYDPKRIVLSIGGYNKEDSRQFTVKGNSPDPGEVDEEEGLVKYELVNYDYLAPDGSSWDRKSAVKVSKTVSNEIVHGVLLVQMIDKRKIKFEAFPGKTASQVSEFSEGAKVYGR